MDRTDRMDRPRQWKSVRRVAMLALLAMLGALAMAGPMIYSEIGGGPGLLRVWLGLVCGGVLAPLFVVAAWRKSTVRATAIVFAPPVAAAVCAALAWSDDYSFTHIALPLAYVTCVLTSFALPDRKDTPDGRCWVCGYDLHASPGNRCPECGEERSRPHRTPFRRIVVPVVCLLGALLVSGTVQLFLVRGILSLG
ncbi:MAG: hypothetical protein HKN62_17765 [Phycisphaerales bacterium]|nr:hypothetical protein [Phycisphaerales bacterium]